MGVGKSLGSLRDTVLGCVGVAPGKKLTLDRSTRSYLKSCGARLSYDESDQQGRGFSDQNQVTELLGQMCSWRTTSRPNTTDQTEQSKRFLGSIAPTNSAFTSSATMRCSI
uniref:Uncharacterized protein n=1 Tax=Physcomitrium patens TaxID=3218 RepID=A0A2K1L835_PHYPA|nr:hypothetical protein PHYPA_000623 [Physcomitrium patens]